MATFIRNKSHAANSETRQGRNTYVAVINTRLAANRAVTNKSYRFLLQASIIE